MQSENKSLVAVYMITYNHQSYIAQAIDSVLRQQTNFDFHLFIGEDCSTDSTLNICKNYAEKYPNKITLFANKQNIGAVNNAQKIYKACFESGAKYVALIEGDDYWTVPYKLQKQFDFLENNHDYIGCIHDANFIDLTEYYPQSKFTVWSENEKMDIPTIFQRGGGCYPTASLVFRVPEEIIDFYSFSKPYLAGDSALIFYLLKFGNFYHFKEQMCVYRLHNNGVYTSKIHNPLKLIEMENNNIELLNAAKQHLKQYYSYINNGISICINNIFEQAFKTGSTRIFTRAIILVTKYSLIIYPFFNYRNLFYLSTVFMFRKVKYQVRKFSNSN